jgi:hypothetical protein
MLVASEGARRGSGWTSRKSASAPAATAARTRCGMKRGSPPLTPAPSPGRCTECVPSKTTGASHASRIATKERMSTTRLP